MAAEHTVHYDDEGLSPSATPSDLPIRSLRDYRLLDELGEGGMGTVYRALHTRLDKVVAIKLLPTARLRDVQAVRRFEREMKAVGRIEHPAIVQALDAGKEGEQLYLVTELVVGSDLSQIIRRLGPFAITDACELIRQVAVALAYAHTNGMVHRDVKPSNVMLASSGAVKILDLGLAVLNDPGDGGGELTSQGQILGTPDYLSPEQALGQVVDSRSDIYSLGCTFYKLLTSQAPFETPERRTPVSKVAAHLHEKVVDVSELRRDVPRKLSALVMSMLQRRPDDRPRSMQDVADRLSEFCAGADLSRLAKQIGEAGVGSIQRSATRTHNGSVGTVPSVGTTINSPAFSREAAFPDTALVATSSGQAFNGRKWSFIGAAVVVVVALSELGTTLSRNAESRKEPANAASELPGKNIGDRPDALPDINGKTKPVPVSDAVVRDKSREARPLDDKQEKVDAASTVRPASVDGNGSGNTANARALQESWAKKLNMPIEQTNSVGIRLALIPPGEFMMGSTVSQINATETMRDVQREKSPVYYKWEQSQVHSLEAPPCRLGFSLTLALTSCQAEA